MNPSIKPDDTNPLAFMAAEWLVKRDRGLTAAEQDEFFQWLAADPRHGEAFAIQQRTWKQFNQLAQWRPEHSAEPNPDLLARPARLVSRRPWLSGLLVAASVAVALLLWSPWKSEQPVVAVETVARDYEQRVLEDGSLIELNRGTMLEVVYTAAERHVRLVQGEASFTVTKNPARPFIVHAGGVDVRAVGTAFNIRLDEKTVAVLVTEGRVRVDDAARGGSLLAAPVAGEIPVLVAGQKVVVEAAPLAPVAVELVSSGEMERLLAWKPRLLDFNSLPLREVIAEFNHRNRTQLVLADSALASLPIVASFRSDNVDGFVRLLELTTSVQAVRTGDTITLKPAR